MKYQMIVLDLDGTLMNTRNEISTRTQNALAELQKRGGKVVLASGRPVTGVVPLADLLGLPRYGSYILAFNGSRIVNCGTKKCIYERNLKPETIHALYRQAHRLGFTVLTYDDTKIYSTPDPSDYANYEVNANHMPLTILEDFERAVTFPVPKCLIIGEADPLAALETELRLKYHGILTINRSFPFFLEVNPKDVNKGSSLSRLLNGLDMNPEQVICCGDGENDIPMIEMAGLGVAMENAAGNVKNAADFITTSNDEDGIAYVIEKFML